MMQKTTIKFYHMVSPSPVIETVHQTWMSEIPKVVRGLSKRSLVRINYLEVQLSLLWAKQGHGITQPALCYYPAIVQWETTMTTSVKDIDLSPATQKKANYN